ncbi:SIS domain-containing protein [Edaphobacter albus]|uniref:SIS domain-containing protein n=1 Tax=Edaphobacter sp. 4G125 TaxID=2763071 RepID=UPI001644D972|nr:SIS domain-containing protein [Edaphobacter sp. 4G125]QNI35954.1 SIS domain-containing protein [Edaphobacter sp. 4G125]
MSQEIWTLQEIHTQPEVWNQSLDHLSSADLAGLTSGYDPQNTEWVFVGCGTSFYLAQAAAFSLSQIAGVSTHALPASEILLFPSLSLPRGPKAYFPVLISRSGHTSEVLQVAEYLQSQKVEFLAITCDGQELANMTSRVLKLPTHEKSTVMTSSFTSMLLGLQFLAATLAGETSFLDSLRSLPKDLSRLLDTYSSKVQDFAQTNLDDVAFLGQGALYPIASETALKVMESSSTYAQYFHTLEFRHGPKSIVGPTTLVGALVSESGYKFEAPVLREMKELGAITMAVANAATDDLRGSADLLIELNLTAPELARLVVYVVWGQLFGSYRGLAKGLDPDNPKNLTRVVTL